MKPRLIALLAGAAAIALVAAGCGSSDDSTTTASITKSQLIKQGDAICEAGNEEINEGFESFPGLKENKEPTEAQQTEITKTILLPSVQKQIDEIRALGAPSGEEEEVTEILDTVEGAVEEGEEDPTSFFGEEGGGVFEEGNKMAQEYGFKVCGNEEEEEG